MPILSIIIPAYNCEKYIAAALGCGLRQGICDCEIIVINDGSTDGTLAVCEAYAEAHPEIRVFSQENRGTSVARNLGISKATGTYIAFLDADDCYVPGCFGAAAADILKEEYDIIMFSAYGANTRRNRYLIGIRHRDGVIPGGRMFPVSGHFAGCLYRRALLEENQIRFAEGVRLNEDQVFKIKALYAAKTVRTCASFSYIYNSTPGSVMHTIDKAFDRVNAWREAKEWFDLHCTDADRKQVFDYLDGKHNSRMLLYAKNYIQSGHTKKQLLQELERTDCLQTLLTISPKQVMLYQARELLWFQNDLGKFILHSRLEGWKISMGRLLLHIPAVRHWRDRRKYPLTDCQ